MEVTKAAKLVLSVPDSHKRQLPVALSYPEFAVARHTEETLVF